jgi:hypothetical protein
MPQGEAKLQPYQRKELIRLVLARAEVSESSLRLQLHGNPASEEVFDKVKAPEGMPLRRFEPFKWLRTPSAGRTPFAVFWNGDSTRSQVRTAHA